LDQQFYISVVYNVIGQRNGVIGLVRVPVVCLVAWNQNVGIPINMILDRYCGLVYDVGKRKRNVIVNNLRVGNVIKSG
jgi:hypothetical protein